MAEIGISPFILSIFLLLLLSLPFHKAHMTSNNEEPFKSLINNLWENRAADIVLFNDNRHAQSSKGISKSIQESGKPMFSFDLEIMLQQVVEKPPCPIVLPYKNVSLSPPSVIKHAWPIPLNKYHKFLFFLIGDQGINKALILVNETLHLCPQGTYPGILGDSSRLFFTVDKKSDMELIGAHKILSHHFSLNFILNEKPSRLVYCGMPCNNQRVQNEFVFITSLGRSPKNEQLNIKEMFVAPSHLFNYSMHIMTMTNGVKPGNDVPKSTPEPTFPLIVILEKALNISIPTLYSPTDGISTVDESGEMHGIYGALRKFDSHMGFNVLSQTVRAVQVGTFSNALRRQQYISFVTGLPRPVPKYLVLIYPFSVPVWIALFVTLIVSPFVFSILGKIEETRLQQALNTFARPIEAIWYCIGTLCGESVGLSAYKRSNSLRIYVLVWLLFCFLMTAGYGGVLYSILSKPEMEKPVDTVKDVVDQNLNVVWTLYFFALEDHAATSSNFYLKTMWERRITYSVYTRTAAQWLSVATEEKTAVIMFTINIEEGLNVFSPPNGEPLLHYKETDIGTFVRSFPTLVFPKMSRFRNTINNSLGRLLNNGIFLKLKDICGVILRQNYFDDGGHVDVKIEKPGYATFVLEDVQGIFYFCIIFTGISCVLWILEMLLGGKKRSRVTIEAP